MQLVLLVLQLADQTALHVNIPLIRSTDYILWKTALSQTIAKAYWIYVRYIIVIFHLKNVHCLRFANKVEYKIGTSFHNIFVALSFNTNSTCLASMIDV